MRSKNIQARDYRYLTIGMLLFALTITARSVYITAIDSYYESELYHTIADKDDIERVSILSNWSFTELSPIQQAEGYYSWGLSLYNLGQLHESEMYLNKVLLSRPGSIGEYLIESGSYDYLHSEASLLLAEIALANKDLKKAEQLIANGIEEYSFSGCGTVVLMRYDRINRLKTKLALAKKDERSGRAPNQ